MERKLIQKFNKHFNQNPQFFVESSGRFEIIGNHTDHNGGLCIAGACNLAISGFLSKRSDNIVNVYSEGYQPIDISLDELNPDNVEKFSSASLIKGVADYFKKNNFKIGGFNLYTKSTIFKGAGVSSSAAFELLIAEIFNSLFNDGNATSNFLAKAGQYAENVYFGKKCGLLDQTSIAFASVSFMDFKNEIKLETLDWKFDDISIYLVNTGGSHADLSDLYSNIPLKMKTASHKMGKERLIECNINDIDKFQLDDEEKRFFEHFYNETKRVELAKKAIVDVDKDKFYKLINESRISSTNLLRNMQVGDNYEKSPLEACDLALSIFNEKGACKINGGGFAGSIVCFVDNDISKDFEIKMKKKYGECSTVNITINNKKPYVKKIY